MKKQLFILLVMSFMSLSFLSANNNYASLWKQVDKTEANSLPKSSLEIVNKILRKAISDKNIEQAIKASIYKTKFQSEINADNETAIFSDLEALIPITNNETDKGLLHSLLAEQYTNYYQFHKWTIDERTDIHGTVPDDIEVWSKNIFYTKVYEHLRESVKAEKVLSKTPIADFSEVLIIDKNTENIYPTMYDFLMKRAISISTDLFSLNNQSSSNFRRELNQKNITNKELILPANEFSKLKFDDNNQLATLFYYAKYLSYLLQKNQIKTIVFTELDRNQYLSSIIETNKESDSFLDALYQKYEKYDVSTEIIYNIINQNRSVYKYVGNEEVQDTSLLAKKYDLLTLGIKNYPNYYRIGILKDELENLTSSYVSVSASKSFYPKGNKTLELRYRNISQIIISITDKDQKEVFVKKLDIKPSIPYLYEKISLDFNLEKIGSYTAKINCRNEQGKMSSDSIEFKISELMSFSRTNPDKSLSFYIVNRKTGTPINGAEVSLYKSEYKNGKQNYIKLGSTTTSKTGLASYTRQNNNDNLYYKVKNGTDEIDFQYCQGSYYYSTKPDTKENELVHLFTDRDIYRPGQIVYFKAVFNGYDNKKQPQPIVNTKYTAVLYDSNDQLVSEKELTTNEFGSIAGEFIIPRGRLNGMYRLGIKDMSQFDTYIKIEEYKKPTFEVVFEKPSNTYTFGDTITLKGYVKNFSGIKLQNTIVDYSIDKINLYRWVYNGYNENIQTGSVITDNNGAFEIKFAIPKQQKQVIQNSFYIPYLVDFEITATTTDINGETQSGSTNFVVGDVSMTLSASIPSQIERNSELTINISATNLDNQKIDVNGNYTIYSVLEKDSIDSQIMTGKFKTSTNSLVSNEIKKLKSGKYLIKFDTKDDQGRLVETQNYFIVYGVDDKKPPITTNEWILENNALFRDGKPAEIVLGVSAKNVTILYELMKGGNLQHHEQFVLSDENKKIVIPYKDVYGENVTALFTYVIDEEVYQIVIDIKKETTINNLALKWNVFRDKVHPNEKEEWSIVVKDKENNPVYAEMLASMYDASLDNISPSQEWRLSTAIYNYTHTFDWSSYNMNEIEKEYISIDKTDIPYPALEWSYFNWFNFYFKYSNLITVSAVSFTPPIPEEDMFTESKAVELNKAVRSSKPKLEQKAGSLTDLMDMSTKQVEVRKNFDETAFFYPQLKTNNKGETLFSFTVPGSNTTWNFRALAYDKAFAVGTLTAKVISQKELMITPNLPRFMRQGDKTSITTKISNLSDNEISGKVYLEFFDPITNEIISSIDIKNQYQNFVLAPTASSDASWLFDVPANIDILGCRIIADSPSFSDGEQHAIVVLPSKILVTESLTMDINTSGTKDFVFEQMKKDKSQSLNNYRLTLEYANNPAWFAIQALPTISNPTNENAVNWFASYYANTLSKSIMQRYPKVSAVINSWITKGGDKDSFISQLEKNDELKTVLLEETPWVLDAKDETEQMQKLALLLNINNSSNQITVAKEKLEKLQNSDGGWSWFNGMQSNRGVTLYLLYGFSELINLNAVEYDSNIKTMQIKALNYLDKEVFSNFNMLKSDNSMWKEIKSIPSWLLEYMYVRSNYRDIPINQGTREAERFYTSVVETYWQNLSFYEKSLLAVLAKRNGNKDLMIKIISSLKEHATIKDDMGMYWANNNSSAFMSQSAVAVHTFIMEAFKEANASTDEMNLMKQWLLKQKQTQNWESTHATIDAIYALLSTGSDWFANNDRSRIYVGKTLAEEKPSDNVLGYVQKSWSNNQITPDMANIKIEKTGNNPSWGAMYWQYFEDLNKISSDNSAALHIEKHYFIEENNQLLPITAKNKLKIGDKVTVRLIVKTDRDFDFVEIKDMRPSCFEPVSQLSGYEFMNNVGYYQSQKDASTNYFFDVLPKGSYVFEYSVYVNREGNYSTGITTIQCMYAPQFVSHTKGEIVIVD